MCWDDAHGQTYNIWNKQDRLTTAYACLYNKQVRKSATEGPLHSATQNCTASEGLSSSTWLPVPLQVILGNGTHFPLRAEQLVCRNRSRSKENPEPLGVMTLVCVSNAVASSLELVLIVSSPEGYGAPRGKGKGKGKGKGTAPSQEWLEPGEGAR